MTAAVTAIPTPTPALITPTLSPASNIIDDEEVRQFVTDHYDATRRRNVDDIVSGYDDPADYLDYGRRDKVFSSEVRLLLISSGWPITSFSFTLATLRCAFRRAEQGEGLF